MNLQSSTKSQGEVVTQIIHFINGEKRTFEDIKTDSIKQGQFTKFKTTDDRLIMNLVDFCNKWNIKLIHISTDHVYANSRSNALETDIPIHGENWYGYTKLLADGLIQLQCKDYLLCRCTHKPTPFPYESAWIDQIGNFDYVDKICNLIVTLIEKECSGIYNVGTNLKSIFTLAKKTKKDIISKLKPNHIPSNVSMDLTKLNNKIK